MLIIEHARDGILLISSTYPYQLLARIQMRPRSISMSRRRWQQCYRLRLRSQLPRFAEHLLLMLLLLLLLLHLLPLGRELLVLLW